MWPATVCVGDGERPAQDQRGACAYILHRRVALSVTVEACVASAAPSVTSAEGSLTAAAEAAFAVVSSSASTFTSGGGGVANVSVVDAAVAAASSAARQRMCERTLMSDDPKETAAAEAALAVARSLASTFPSGEGGWSASRWRMRPSLCRRQQHAGVCSKGRKICARQ